MASWVSIQTQTAHCSDRKGRAWKWMVTRERWSRIQAARWILSACFLPTLRTAYDLSSQRPGRPCPGQRRFLHWQMHGRRDPAASRRSAQPQIRTVSSSGWSSCCRWCLGMWRWLHLWRQLPRALSLANRLGRASGPRTSACLSSSRTSVWSNTYRRRCTFARGSESGFLWPNRRFKWRFRRGCLHRQASQHQGVNGSPHGPWEVWMWR